MSVYKNDNLKQIEIEPDNRYQDIRSLLRGQCLFLDYELTQSFSAIKKLYDIFKSAKKRFDRRDTLQVAQSLARYYQFEVDKARYPYILFDFVQKNFRICIVSCESHYHIYTNIPYFDTLCPVEKIGANLFCDFKSLSECKNRWLEYIRNWINSQLSELPF